jgi:peptidoglycan/LPS O-acetylase OafA/YrhL
MQIRRLNTLRGLAALVVAVSHYSNASGLWHGVLGHGAGQFGVMIFFLLSAFLMAHLYLETPPTAQALGRYATARFARVMPLFLVVVVASFAAASSPALGSLAYEIPDWRSLLSHLLLLQGVGVLWTIPPEIHFYVLFAGAWLAYPRFKRSLAMVSMLVLCAYVLVAWPEAPSTTLFGLPATFTLVRVLPYFIVGAGLGYAFRHWRAPARMQSHWYAATLLVLPLLYPEIYLLVTGRAHGMWLDPLILACVSLVFFAVVFLVPAGNRVLETRAGDKLGQVSYSLYLLHGPLLTALNKAGLVAGVSGLLLFLALAIALAMASFALIEAPARRMIRRRSVFASSVD